MQANKMQDFFISEFQPESANKINACQIFKNVLDIFENFAGVNFVNKN